MGGSERKENLVFYFIFQKLFFLIEKKKMMKEGEED
jgi:hypothetical protein